MKNIVNKSSHIKVSLEKILQYGIKINMVWYGIVWYGMVWYGRVG